MTAAPQTPTPRQAPTPPRAPIAAADLDGHPGPGSPAGETRSRAVWWARLMWGASIPVGAIGTFTLAATGGLNMNLQLEPAVAPTTMLVASNMVVGVLVVAVWGLQVWALARLPRGSRTPRVVLAVMAVLLLGGDVLGWWVSAQPGAAVSPVETVAAVIQAVLVLGAAVLIFRPGTSRDLARARERTGDGADRAAPRTLGTSRPDDVTVPAARPFGEPPAGFSGAVPGLDATRRRVPGPVAWAAAGLVLVPAVALASIGGVARGTAESMISTTETKQAGATSSAVCPWSTGLAVAFNAGAGAHCRADIGGTPIDVVLGSAPDGSVDFTTPGVGFTRKLAASIEQLAAQAGHRVSARCGSEGQIVVPLRTGTQIPCVTTDTDGQHAQILATVTDDAGNASVRRVG